MGKDMTFFLFIGMFQGIVAETKAFRKEEDAKRRFFEFTDHKYDWDLVNEMEYACERLGNSDYAGSQISELQIEA